MNNIRNETRDVFALSQIGDFLVRCFLYLFTFIIIFFITLSPSFSALAACPQDISLGYYTLQGIPTFESGGLVKIRHNKDASLTLKAENILEGILDEKLNSFNFKIKPNTKVTFSYKTISHDFIMSENQNPFYIDTNELKITSVSTKIGDNSKLRDTSNCENYCYKSVYAWDCNCCKGGYVGECYGWVTCGAGWKEKDCMKGVNEEIYCANNC